VELADVGGLGIAGALVLVVAYLLTAMNKLLEVNRNDRSDYLAALSTRDRAHSAELSAARANHDTELATLRVRLAALETRIAELESDLDAERERRRAAEDQAAAARRRRP
jgi:predicted  nucleic acid-binding Zn-ribbon protein